MPDVNCMGASQFSGRKDLICGASNHQWVLGLV